LKSLKEKMNPNENNEISQKEKIINTRCGEAAPATSPTLPISSPKSPLTGRQQPANGEEFNSPRTSSESTQRVICLNADFLGTAPNVEAKGDKVTLRREASHMTYARCGEAAPACKPISTFSPSCAALRAALCYGVPKGHPIGQAPKVLVKAKRLKQVRLRAVKRAIDVIRKNPDWNKDVNRFYFAIFNFILSPKKEQDNEDIKRYIAQEYVQKSSTFKNSLVRSRRLMASMGYAVSLFQVCQMRSGLEFLASNFADVLLFQGDYSVEFKDRNWENSKLFGEYMETLKSSQLLRDFDTCLTHFCQKYQLSEPIPTGIPETHWWWRMAAEKKRRASVSPLDDDFRTDHH
jgi:hypothetical protein